MGRLSTERGHDISDFSLTHMKNNVNRFDFI
uniref:Uncharacterized protein n=1 Tax=Siphoviridae sp. ctQtc11 TaxID=2825497 RepID=A0A8S5P5L5_9CAUD|nr:MAG TPA: hypothetical protein [Siphoviridae sp. ctQtc11]